MTSSRRRTKPSVNTSPRWLVQPTDEPAVETSRHRERMHRQHLPTPQRGPVSTDQCDRPVQVHPMLVRAPPRGQATGSMQHRHALADALVESPDLTRCGARLMPHDCVRGISNAKTCVTGAEAELPVPTRQERRIEPANHIDDAPSYEQVRGRCPPSARNEILLP